MQKIDFEKSLSRLEEITQQLESGNLTLDESLKIFEEGIRLSRMCEKKLTDAEQKLEILKNTDINELPEDNAMADEALEEQTIVKKKAKKVRKESESNPADDEEGSFLF